MSVDPFEIRAAPTSGLRWATGLTRATSVFLGLLAALCLVGVLTQNLDSVGTLTALVIGGVSVWGAFGAARASRGLRSVAAQPEVLARLDDEGVHLHEGAGIPDLPEQAARTTVPWDWVTSVSHSTIDLRTAKLLGLDVPLEVLRFVLADDRLLDAPPVRRPDLDAAAVVLGLTPGQARTLLLAEAGETSYADAVAWVQRHRPAVPTLTGTSLPWWTRATPDAWPDSPRIAVVGASGRLGRLVLEVLARREKAAPVALARNEAQRARLEALGAEVRMVDLAQGPRAVERALQGCAGVLHLAPTGADVVVEAARHAGVSRLLAVAGAPGRGDQETEAVARSGLAWTVFRPSLLTDDPPTGEVALGHDVTAGPVPRADLAEVVVAAIRDEDSAGDVWPIAGVASPDGH